MEKNLRGQRADVDHAGGGGGLKLVRDAHVRALEIFLVARDNEQPACLCRSKNDSVSQGKFGALACACAANASGDIDDCGVDMDNVEANMIQKSDHFLHGVWSGASVEFHYSNGADGPNFPEAEFSKASGWPFSASIRMLVSKSGDFTLYCPHHLDCHRLALA